MPLDSTVLVTENQVASLAGATLSQGVYTLFGVQIPQGDWQEIMNTAAWQEQNEVGSTIYNASDSLTANAMKNWQIWDCVYRVYNQVPARIQTGAVDWSLGPMHVTVSSQVQQAIKDAKFERDKAFNELQQMEYTLETVQPTYGQTSPPVY